jgi:nickel-dependent lactate racemase
LLEELHAAGIKDDQIQFIVALGAHGAHSRIEFAKKLGEDIVRRYPVYNHNCYENNMVVGKTSKGNEVAINSEYWKCDLKIGIGSVLPHPYTGFSGTGKIVVPGISSIETTAETHFEASVGAREKGLNPVTGLGKWEESDMRKEVEEIALMAGPDFVLQALVGTRRQLIGLISGHPVAAYHAAVEQALKAYCTPKASNMDVVVANASAKACEGVIAFLMGIQSLKESGGDVVVISHSPTGQITHYLLGPFGRTTAAGRFCSRGTSFPPNIERVIVYSPYPSYADAEWFAPTDKVVWATTWQEVLDLLGDRGPGTKVAVYEDATMMYLSE